MFLKGKKHEKNIIKRSKYWDENWYKKTYLYNNDLDPVEHFLSYGWKRGYAPSTQFDARGYLDFYEDVKAQNINPLLHYEKYGKKEGRFVKDFELNTIRNSKFFNITWYQETYQVTHGDEHYLKIGWKLGYNPSLEFSTLSYLAFNYDVRSKEINPLVHYERYGKYENRMRIFKESIEAGLTEKQISEYKNKQDQRIQKQYSKYTEKLVVFLVPERDAVCGGLMSIASLARVTKNSPEMKEWSVIIATCPSKNTFCDYTKFEAGFDIFRFEQITKYFINLKSVIIHIPENFVGDFVIKLPVKDMLVLQKLNDLQINIMNQNMLLMLRPSDIEKLLRKICPNLTMTVAHKQYCTRQLRTSYNMPVHLFSASNLTKYYFTSYAEKKNVLVYSPDDHPYKKAILDKIKKNLPTIKMVEIKNMSYEQYKRIISEAKWMLSFGEGLDGYFVESIRSGAIPFTVYNDVFFDDRFSNLPNVYDSYADMYGKIIEDITWLDVEERFSTLNKKLYLIDQKAYDDNEYISNVRAYYQKKYSFPLDAMKAYREKNISNKPLVSIVMASYNGEKYILKQLYSLMKLTYSNYEIIISDDGSTDRTVDIIRSYQKYLPLKLVFNKEKHGLNENFANAIRHASGEYIALCDQDDMWLPRKLENLLERIDDFDIVFGNVKVIDENDALHPVSIMHDAYEGDKTKFYHFSDYIGENVMLGCTSLIRRDFLQKCMPIPEGILYHDWWFVLKAIVEGKGICYIDIPVIKYRQHGKNTAKSTFDSVDWYKRKSTFDATILNEFGKKLHTQERAIVEKDRCWNIMKDLLRYRCTSYVEEFFDNNKMSFDPEFINELYMRMHDKA